VTNRLDPETLGKLEVTEAAQSLTEDILRADNT
jgi:hypothetical protein